MSSKFKRLGCALGISALVVGGAGPVSAAQSGPHSPAGPDSRVGSGGPARAGGQAGISRGVAPAASPGRRPAKDRVVTLITGDRVVLAGGDVRRPRIIPGEGRRRVKFSTQGVGDELSVIPSDVAGLVAQGRVDERLFDVAGLLRDGYDDARTTSIPLIVTYEGTQGTSSTAARAITGAAGAKTVRELPAVNGSAVRVAKGNRFLDALPVTAQRIGGGIEKVWLDGKRRTSLDESVKQIGTPAAWQAGLTGKGVTVAVLDSGIDAGHPDLAGQVVEARNFSGEPTGDLVGHGTHVAATIAGKSDKYRGVAPDARLLDGQVCGNDGCPESAILAGMQWAAVEKKADVVNISLGGTDSPELDPLEEAVNTLTAQSGALFVVSAGNRGRKASVGSPGSAAAALTVGAVDREDRLAEFSSRGPRVGDGAVKPDLTAPGVDIVAAKAKDGWMGDPVGAHHARMSGTSMATPHVTGAAALLAQQRPDWTAGDLKAALMASAKTQPAAGAFDQGAGRVDVARAIDQTVVSQPASLSFGVARWPHHDDEPVTKQLAYRNRGSVEVTLALRVAAFDSNGDPAPAGALTTSASSVTVPAGGTATVDVTSDTRIDGPDGAYSGWITATAGEVSVVTPVGGEKEVESYNLTLTHLDPTGQPTEAGATAVIRPQDKWETMVSDADGTVELRLPKAEYLLESRIFVDKGNDLQDVHAFVRPMLRFDRDTSITVDGRDTRPIGTTVPRPAARPALIEAGYVVDFGDVGVYGRLSTFDYGGIFTAPQGDALPGEALMAYVTSQWGVPDATGKFVNSPYTYSLMNFQHGRIFHGFRRTVRDSELAQVNTQYNSLSDRRVVRAFFGGAPGRTSYDYPYFWYDVPSRAKHLFDTTGPWGSSLTEWGPDGRLTEFFSGSRTYQAGRSYVERWNAAVAGPAFPSEWCTFRPGEGVDWCALRKPEATISFGLEMSSDQDGNVRRADAVPASTKLYRNGELLGESDAHGALSVEDVPAEPGDFKLVTTASRQSVSELSTRIDAAWTFKSQAVTESQPLPLSAVRYAPRVDIRNTVKRQPVTVLPVTIETQPGSKPGTLRTLRIQVSGDDGKTWAKATVRRTGDNRYVAVFATPKGATYVSLKANAADSDGNTTEQSIIRAYALR